MVAFYQNGILCRCDECLRVLKERIINNDPFDFISSVHKKNILTCILSILVYENSDILFKPKETREKITRFILMNSSFSIEEIDDLFSEYSKIRYSFFSPEYENEHPEINSDWGLAAKIYDGELKAEYFEEIYIFPVRVCDWFIDAGLCPTTLLIERCPDCGEQVINYPENIDISNNCLVCPRCNKPTDPYYLKKGFVKRGGLTHHGDWPGGNPKLIFSGTDYFGILHPHCRNATNEEGTGIMEVNGVYVDDCGRVVLSLQCKDCGVTNALKPFVISDSIPILSIEGSTWKKTGSSIDDLIWQGEGENIEFKSTLWYDLETNKKNRELVKGVLKTIAAFLNTTGGSILIGIDDSGNVVGLNPDYSLMVTEDANNDNYQQLIRNLISDKLGNETQQFISMDFWEKGGEEVCRIDVQKSDSRVLLDGEYYFRAGNTTRKK